MQHSEMVKRIEELQCTKCGGSGEYDDAEPGDISCRTFVCDQCRGTGWADGIERTLLRA